MAALTGYVSGGVNNSEHLRHTISFPQPSAFSSVFGPDHQSYNELAGTATTDGFILSVPPITRKVQVSKTGQIGRSLRGPEGVGPAGERIGRYSDDFYHRIHITPSRINLGNLISTQFRTVEVWNAFLHSVDLEDVETFNGDGLTVTPPVATPYTMAALEPLEYDLKIASSGPPAISARIRWTIDGEEYEAPITGSRVVPITMSPDWKEPMVETLEWKTDVIRSYSGKEQRAKIRNKPRRGQSYNYTLVDDEAASLENLLWGWQARLYAVPHWTETTLRTQSLFAGQTGIPVTTESYSYGEGGLVFITDGVTYEMQEIESVEPGVVNLKKGLDSAWGGPYVIGPANLARIDGDFSVKTKRDSSNVMSTVMQFMHQPTTTDPYIPIVAAPNTYLGEEVWLMEPNWKDGMGVDFISDGNALDFGLQTFGTSIGSGIPEIVSDYEWLLKNRADMKSFRGFLGRRSGRFGGFWLPSWRKDFKITEPVTSGTSGFSAAENYYGTLVKGAEGRNHVFVLLKDGTVILKEISSAEIDGLTGFVNVVTTTTMGVTFQPSEVKICCIMNWSRLYSDKLSIRYLDRNVATVKTTMVNTLP